MKKHRISIKRIERDTETICIGLGATADAPIPKRILKQLRLKDIEERSPLKKHIS
jgi:hypothetical protein